MPRPSTSSCWWSCPTACALGNTASVRVWHPPLTSWSACICAPALLLTTAGHFSSLKTYHKTLICDGYNNHGTFVTNSRLTMLSTDLKRRVILALAAVIFQFSKSVWGQDNELEITGSEPSKWYCDRVHFNWLRRNVWQYFCCYIEKRRPKICLHKQYQKLPRPLWNVSQIVPKIPKNYWKNVWLKTNYYTTTKSC